jgi:hypothetical protein
MSSLFKYYRDEINEQTYHLHHLIRLIPLVKPLPIICFIFSLLSNWGCFCVGCIVGDDVDGVPGIQHVAPGFGRKTALKLLKKHGSLENLLNAAAVRTVGKQYAQDALTKYADYLRRNYEVLALRR